MIGVKLRGRLGNQLFQYAFAISASKSLKTFYFIDETPGEDFVERYFEFGTISRRRIKSRFLLTFFNRSKLDVVYQTGTDDIESIFGKIKNNAFYDGYFQSEKYFNLSQIEIKNNLKIKKRYKNLFEKKYPELVNQKYIAIHCRLGDYLTWKHDILNQENLSLPAQYYHNALATLQNSDKLPVVIVTDDPENFNFFYPSLSKYTLISDSEIIDFQILSNATKVIISNSTFSWWAAYLNKIPDKVVLAPFFWLGYEKHLEYPKGIMTSEFKWLKAS